MHTLPKRALAVACAAALLGTGTSALAAGELEPVCDESYYAPPPPHPPASPSNWTAGICPSLTPHRRRGTAAPSCLCAPCLRPWGPR